ncbi:MAG: metal-dependent transcriptional regulator [Anaerolineaceae bacterium]|nr:metal-dependent transcriptional regulator [Anaerolineaceae bacterium]
MINKITFMGKKPTPTIEDYLGIIYTLSRDGKKVIAARLAELIGVSPPTVTVTIKRMLRDNWISINEKKHIFLTPKGNNAARAVIRRHMLTEWLLSRVLDIPWSELHSEADKIEHTISDGVEKSLITALNEPVSCPHGNPMPGHESISENWLPLTKFQAGDKCIIRRIHEWLENDPKTMHFLETNFIRPGEMANLMETILFSNNVAINIRGKPIHLSPNIAENIFAEKLAN